MKHLSMKNIALSLSFLILTSNFTFAQTPEVQNNDNQSKSKQGFYVGTLMGPAIVTSKSGGTYFGWGLNMGFDVSKSVAADVSLGLIYFTSKSNDRISNVDVGQRVSLFGIEALAKNINQSPMYAGVRFGIAPINVNVSTSTTDLSSGGTSFGVAPVVGASFNVTQNFYLGLDLSYMIIFASEVTGDLGTLKTNTITALLPMLNAKFIF